MIYGVSRKIVTLRQTLDVTEELGRHAPNGRDEVARSKRQISQKLVKAMAELMYLTDEIPLEPEKLQLEVGPP